MTEDRPLLPPGWVEYIEHPLTSKNARIVRCPIEAAPAWVQKRHINTPGKRIRE